MKIASVDSEYYFRTKEDLQKDGVVFQIGVAPRRIDIITSASGLDFKEAYKHSVPVDIDEIEVRIPSIEDLIRNKRATGRTKDLADVEELEFRRASEKSTRNQEKKIGACLM